jgi:hypothetical protein
VVSKSVPTPRDVQALVCREFVGVLQEWIRSLERDERALILRGNRTFSAHVARMAREARHVLDVLTA